MLCRVSESPSAPTKSVVNLSLYCVGSGKWFKKCHTYILYGIHDFYNILPSPWGPLPTLIVTVNMFVITYFQQVHRDFSLTL